MTSTTPRILIAYDGSECAEAAIDDLRRAGLPARADALVYSVAEVWLPVTEFSDVVEHTFPGWFDPEIDQARVLAAAAAARVREQFPEWNVEVDVELGSAALRILRKAEAWRPGLLITGSRGRTAVGNVTLGSISQTISVEAPCSVRVARTGGDPEEPARIAIGVDGSASGAAAVEAVARRAWREGSEILLVTALTSSGLPADAARTALARVRELHDRAEERLRHSGLSVSATTAEGNPRAVLLEEAERWNAGCVFVGTRGLSNFVRSPLGSVSTAVVTRARCSVEVVR